VQLQKKLRPVTGREENSNNTMQASIKEGSTPKVHTISPNPIRKPKKKNRYELDLNHLELLENIGALTKIRNDYYPNSLYAIEFILFQHVHDLYKSLFSYNCTVDQNFTMKLDEKEYKMIQNGKYKSTIKLSNREESIAIVHWYYVY
jgi:hypothetical protein